MKKIILTKFILITTFTFLIFSYLGSKVSVFAWIPGSVEGNVYLELVDGTRIPAKGAKIYRQDYWNYSYCETEKCFGYKSGVETTVLDDGNYKMGNEGNIPGPACYTVNIGGKANLCPAGEKGKINYNLAVPGTVNECKKLEDGTYQYSTDLNWCGFNCGSNPHRWEAYFPSDYKLPGQLEDLGYSIEKGTWKTIDSSNPDILKSQPYYEEEVGNHGTVYRKDFIYVLDTPVPPDTPPKPDEPKPNDKAEVRCKSLSGYAVGGSVEYALSEIPPEFKGELFLTCIAEAKIEPVTNIEFTLVKNVNGKETIEKKDVDSSNIVQIADCSEGYTCYSATVDFDIEGPSSYKVFSRACNKDHLCSP